MYRRAALAFLVVASLLGGCSRAAVDPFPDAFVGIGVELTAEVAGARVTKVLPGGPAATAGLVENDVLLEVAGKDTRGRGLADIVEDLRGAPDTHVAVLVRTAGGPKTVTLTRRALARSGDAYTAR